MHISSVASTFNALLGNPGPKGGEVFATAEEKDEDDREGTSESSRIDNHARVPPVASRTSPSDTKQNRNNLLLILLYRTKSLTPAPRAAAKSVAELHLTVSDFRLRFQIHYPNALNRPHGSMDSI